MNDIEFRNIYQCQQFEEQLEKIAVENEGEIPEEALQALVQANTTSLAKLESMVGYIKYVDYYIERGKAEMDRIKRLLDQAKKRQSNIKAYITPYVEHERNKKGRPIDVGTNRLSTRRSKKVEITDPETFAAGGYPNESTKKVTFVPNKTVLKEVIEKKGHHPGAEITESINLVIK